MKHIFFLGFFGITQKQGGGSSIGDRLCDLGQVNKLGLPSLICTEDADTSSGVLALSQVKRVIPTPHLAHGTR